MEHREDHPLQAFWNLAAAPMQVRAVELALEQGLFARLAAPATARQVADALGWRPEATAVWLDLLWGLGLLTRSEAVGEGAALAARSRTEEPVAQSVAAVAQGAEAAPAVKLPALASAVWAGAPAEQGTKAAEAAVVGNANLGRDGADDGCSPRYQRSELAAQHFVAGASGDCGEAWRYRARTLARMAAQMTDLLRGQDTVALPAENQATPGGWAQAAQAQIGQEQRVVAVPQMLQCLDRLEGLPGQGRFLDLGGGPGYMAQAIALRLPGWRGVVCDLPETVEVARRRLAEAGLADRIEGLAADLDHEGFGEGYDLIWCSSVLHFLTDPLALPARLHAALRPGGRLLIAHAEQAGDPALAARVLPFYAPMLLRGKYLPRPGEIAAALRMAGFQEVRALGRLAFPMAPVWCYEGRRA